jgi:hypothetical protein
MIELTSRRHMLAAIFLAKSELAIPEREWRDIVTGVTGRRNCAEASDGELRRLLAALTRREAPEPETMPEAALPDDGSALRGILAEIAEIAGRDAALKLARAKGGVEKVYIPEPENLCVDHWLVETLGWKAALRLARRFGPDRISIPLGPFAFRRPRSRAALRDALAEGSSTAEAARRAGVSQRTARRWRLERRAEDGG